MDLNWKSLAAKLPVQPRDELKEAVLMDVYDGGELGANLILDALDGAGLEELLLDAVGHGGDTLDNPSGTYTLYRHPPEHGGGT